jgi:hypothetical protein
MLAHRKWDLAQSRYRIIIRNFNVGMFEALWEKNLDEKER